MSTHYHDRDHDPMVGDIVKLSTIRWINYSNVTYNGSYPFVFRTFSYIRYTQNNVHYTLNSKLKFQAEI